MLKMSYRVMGLGFLAVAMGVPVAAQFEVAGKQVQVHAFFQQGFSYSSGNNFLTMKTNSGSFSMTDGGFNISARLTPRLRVGAQVFSRNIGELGNGKVVLDWAVVDYKFNDYLGFRGGKVKTTIGLFNDTQDMEFIHTWALLPQAVYPTDLRATTISHVGGDMYGELPLKKAGRVAYTAYYGSRPIDRRGGYFIGTRDAGTPLDGFTSWVKGGDVRWLAPVEGLVAGYSYFGVDGHGTARLLSFAGFPTGPGGIPFRFDIEHSNTSAFYGDFQRGKLRVSAELWRTGSLRRFTGIPIATQPADDDAWYVMGSYRVHPKVEFGGYFSQFRLDRTLPFSVQNGTRGPTVTARVDLNKYWNVKVEGHFIDGYGSPFSFRSFYPSTNPQGMKDRTNLLVIRTGVAF